MGIDKSKINRDIKISSQKVEARKECRAKEMTITFCFKYLSCCDDFNFQYFAKSISEATVAGDCILNQLKLMSQSTYQGLLDKGRAKGIEHMPIDELSDKFMNSLSYPFSPDDKLGVVKFNGKKYRMLFKRGTKCPRVVHVLGFEFKLGTIYSH